MLAKIVLRKTNVHSESALLLPENTTSIDARGRLSRMPAALDVDWDAVHTLALSIGVRPAARAMGLSEEAVMQRSSREGWLRDLPRSTPLPPTVVRPVSGVSTAAQAMAQSMREDALRGRAAALRVSRRALERVDRMDDDELVQPEVAGMAHTWTKSAALAGGYAASDSVAKVNLQVTSAREQSVDAQEIEAEWTDA